MRTPARAGPVARRLEQGTHNLTGRVQAGLSQLGKPHENWLSRAVRPTRDKPLEVPTAYKSPYSRSGTSGTHIASSGFTRPIHEASPAGAHHFSTSPVTPGTQDHLRTIEISLAPKRWSLRTDGSDRQPNDPGTHPGHSTLYPNSCGRDSDILWFHDDALVAKVSTSSAHTRRKAATKYRGSEMGNTIMCRTQKAAAMSRKSREPFE